MTGHDPFTLAFFGARFADYRNEQNRWNVIGSHRSHCL